MRCWLSVALLLFSLASWAIAQQDSQSADNSGQNQSSAKSDQEKSRDRSAEAGESSSRDTRIDLSPPKDDAKKHPNSGAALQASPAKSPEDMTDMTGVHEMHPWNPYRAIKDDEVGDFYLKQGDYKGALARYQDALIYKQNDAVAQFRMAQCYEKMNQPAEAIPHYQQYLKILPQGPFSKQAKKALERLEREKQSSEKISSR
jgi:tetratricopeptide (TPR) repeat protein